MSDLLGMERKANNFRNLDQRAEKLFHGCRIDSTLVCTVQVLLSYWGLGGGGRGGGWSHRRYGFQYKLCSLPYIKYKVRVLDDDLSLFSLYLISFFIPLREDKKSKTTNTSLFSVQRPNSWMPWDFYFFKLTQPLTVSTVQLLYTVKEKGGKPDRKLYPLPYGLCNP